MAAIRSSPLTYEKPLQAVKARLAAGAKVFETLIQTTLLDNHHRTTVLLKADTKLADEEVAEERARLDDVAASMDDDEREDVVEMTAKLKALQNEADPPAALAKIPTLGLKDLDTTNKPIPIERGTIAGARLYTHALPTNRRDLPRPGLRSARAFRPSSCPISPSFRAPCSRPAPPRKISSR